MRDFTPTNNKTLGVLPLILDKARTINKINSELAHKLPYNLQNNIRLINIDLQLAVFTCNSAAMAFRAKQQQDLILSSLKQNPKTKHIKAIKIKVLPQE